MSEGGMVEPELAGLVATAAGTIVTLMATDAWQRAKAEVVSLWRRFRPGQADAVESDLDDTREQILVAPATSDKDALQLAAAEWESRLSRLLAADAAAASALRDVLAVLEAMATESSRPQPGRVSVRQRATAKDHSSVIQMTGTARIGKT